MFKRRRVLKFEVSVQVDSGWHDPIGTTRDRIKLALEANCGDTVDIPLSPGTDFRVAGFTIGLTGEYD